MSELVRLSITMEEELYELLEEALNNCQVENRSEFIRDLIRSKLVEDKWKSNDEVLGTITIVYNNHSSDLHHKLTHIQHHHHSNVIVNTHLHLDKDICAEIIVARGKAKDIKTLSDAFRQNKSVIHTAVSMSTTGKEVA